MSVIGLVATQISTFTYAREETGKRGTFGNHFSSLHSHHSAQFRFSTIWLFAEDVMCTLTKYIRVGVGWWEVNWMVGRSSSRSCFLFQSKVKSLSAPLSKLNHDSRYVRGEAFCNDKFDDVMCPINIISEGILFSASIAPKYLHTWLEPLVAFFSFGHDSISQSKSRKVQIRN